MDSKNGWFEFSNPLDLSSYLFDVILIKRNSSQIFLSSAFVAKLLFHLEHDPLQQCWKSKSSSKSHPVLQVQRDAEPSSVMKEKVLRREQCCNVLEKTMLSTFVRNCNFCNSSSSPCVTIRGGGILIPSHAPWWRLWLWSCVFKPPTFPACSSEIFAALWV